ncbi:hypothetical protein B0A48_06839 [Cryoendolithus antarcticus]|uniref:Uncharacterized protein n=1 Tax=Cryoendolithus antarcticus TaxID=1507870 RepID=A0A1V8T9G5_9PEZI|nr:hypothetical protein B0A48_06839 [Cryoendolithus antarcticus]
MSGLAPPQRNPSVGPGAMGQQPAQQQGGQAQNLNQIVSINICTLYFSQPPAAPKRPATARSYAEPAGPEEIVSL